MLKIVDKLDKFNVDFKSCSEAFDTSTPTGKLMMNLLASVGEFERETIVENVKMGMKQRAKMGKWNGGIVLGYRSIKFGQDKEKTRLEIIEEEAEIVRMIFELYASGRGLRSLVNHINQLGYKTKKGNMFAIATIKEILQNPIYIGKIRYNRMQNWNEKIRKGKNSNPIIVDGEHEPIIDLNLWNKVQKIYKERSQKPIRNFSGSYPLTGLLKCPECGASMVAGVTKKKRKDGTYNVHKYYFCGNWRNKGIAACHSNSIRKDNIEEIVFNKINEVLYDKSILEDLVININKKSKEIIKPLENQLNHIERELRALEIKKEECINHGFTYKKSKAGLTWDYLQFIHGDSKILFLIKNAAYFNEECFSQAILPANGNKKGHRRTYLHELSKINKDLDFPSNPPLLNNGVNEQYEQLSFLVPEILVKVSSNKILYGAN